MGEPMHVLGQEVDGKSLYLPFNFAVNLKLFLKNYTLNKKNRRWGTWVAPSVKRPTLDFGSGHDLPVHEFELPAGSALMVWSLLGNVSPSLSAPPLLVFSLSLSLSL